MQFFSEFSYFSLTITWCTKNIPTSTNSLLSVNTKIGDGQVRRVNLTLLNNYYPKEIYLRIKVFLAASSEDNSPCDL